MKIRVRSIFTKIVLWFTATFVLSLVGYVATSMLLSARLADREPMMPRLNALFLDDASRAYEEGGPTRLAEYLERLNSYTEGEHFLVDARGRDLVSGEDRSGLLAQRATPHAAAGPAQLARASCGWPGPPAARGRPSWSTPPATVASG